MTFLYPTYFWALLGLTIPLAIHLWSKKEGRTLRVGSIQLLKESNPKKSRSIQLNEFWLLLLRMLIISVLVLILTGPQLKIKNAHVPVTYLIEPSLLTHENVRILLDTLNPDAEKRLFQSGFPEYQNREIQQSKASIPNYWQLIQEITELPADSIVVFTNAFTSGFKGKRPVINKNINWIILDPGKPVKDYIGAVQKRDHLELNTVISDHQNLRYEKERLPLNSDGIVLHANQDSVMVMYSEDPKWIFLKKSDTLNVLLSYDQDRFTEMKYISASINAIAKYLERNIRVKTLQDLDTQMPENYDLVVWLRTVRVPPTEIPILVFKADSLANSIITEGSSANIFYLTGTLNAENSTQQHLSEHLLRMLGLQPDLRDKIKEHDRRVLDPRELPQVVEDNVNTQSFSEIRDFSNYLWILLGLLIISERGVSAYRKQ